MNAPQIAQDFLATCQANGYKPVITGQTVRIAHRFPPGDREGFLLLDCDITSLLYTLPRTGSVYGVDGVGGMIALERGYGTVSATGVRKSVINALNTQRKVAQ